MINIKKIISLILIAGCVAACFTGCKENDVDPVDDNKIVWKKEYAVSGTETLAAGEECSFDINADTELYNYVGMEIKTDVPVTGTMYFEDKDEEEEGFTEDFFVSGGTDGFFCQIIDYYVDHVYNRVVSKITFKNVGDEEGTVSLGKFCCKQKEMFDDSQVFLTSGDIRLGIDMNAGGSINYLEYLNHNVQQVKDYDGSVKVGINYAQEYGTDAFSSSVNLINEFDRGRLVQQSYYGSSVPPYECAQYIGMAWPYNPVQGGDYTGTSSQIIDFDFSDTRLYIKARALDWAKVESVTPSYMENVYTIENGVVKVENTFTDWSEYTHSSYRDQELPAFYGIISLGTL
ncbi:MAG: hypothetical protein ACI4S9_07355, partial [Christensenellales bacterium]